MYRAKFSLFIVHPLGRIYSRQCVRKREPDVKLDERERDKWKEREKRDEPERTRRAAWTCVDWSTEINFSRMRNKKPVVNSSKKWSTKREMDDYRKRR